MENLYDFFSGGFQYVPLYLGPNVQINNKVDNEILSQHIRMHKRDLLDIIKKNGGRLARSSKHEIWQMPDGSTSPVPHGNGSKEIPEGTSKAIQKQLGIDPKTGEKK